MNRKDLLNEQKLEEIGRMFLEAVDINPDREGLKETPKRFAKYWVELLEGQKYTNAEIAKMYDKCFMLPQAEGEQAADEAGQTSLKRDLVVEKDIRIFSHCEHHIALMYDMSVAVAYIPRDRIIGLSKIARIAQMVGKRLQLQERIGSDINEIMRTILHTKDVAVVITGKHACMTARGIKSEQALTITSSLSGVFQTDAKLRQEMLSLVK